jgi:hypothetical protein
MSRGFREPEWPGILVCEDCGAYLPEEYVLPVGLNGVSKLLCEDCTRKRNEAFMKGSDS